MAVREVRLQIMLAPDELKALENWRFAARMPSRAAAVRELLRRGLAAEGFLASSDGSKSTDYGVTEARSANIERGNGGGVELDD